MLTPTVRLRVRLGPLLCIVGNPDMGGILIGTTMALAVNSAADTVRMNMKMSVLVGAFLAAAGSVSAQDRPLNPCNYEPVNEQSGQGWVDYVLTQERGYSASFICSIRRSHSSIEGMSQHLSEMNAEELRTSRTIAVDGMEISLDLMERGLPDLIQNTDEMARADLPETRELVAASRRVIEDTQNRIAEGRAIIARSRSAQ